MCAQLLIRNFVLGHTFYLAPANFLNFEKHPNSVSEDHRRLTLMISVLKSLYNTGYLLYP